MKMVGKIILGMFAIALLPIFVLMHAAKKA